MSDYLVFHTCSSLPEAEEKARKLREAGYEVKVRHETYGPFPCWEVACKNRSHEVFRSPKKPKVMAPEEPTEEDLKKAAEDIL